MSAAVWKYELSPSPLLDIDMPAGAEVIRVATQPIERPCLWALVDPAAEMETRQFLVVGTGWDFESSGTRYVGSFSLTGPLEFHVFEADR